MQNSPTLSWNCVWLDYFNELLLPAAVSQQEDTQPCVTPLCALDNLFPRYYMFLLISKTISSKCHLVRRDSSAWITSESCRCCAGGEAEGCGVVLPSSPPAWREGGMDSESLYQLLVKEEGKRGEFWQGGGTSGGDSDVAFSMSTAQMFPSELSAEVLQSGHSSQAHPDLGFLASREDPKLLQAILISGLVLKWLAEGRERQS